MVRTITLTADHGTALLRSARTTVYPEKIGGLTFTSDERATFSRWFTKLWKKLKEHSELFKKDTKMEFFGPASWYEEQKLSDEEIRKGGLNVKRTFMVLHELEGEVLSVELEDVECKAVYLLCLQWLHPESKAVQGSALQEEFVWPLLRELGSKTVAQAEKQTGLVNSKGIEVDLGDASEKAEEKKETAHAVTG